MGLVTSIYFGWFAAIHLFEVIVFPSMLHPNEVLSYATLTERLTLIWTTNADTAHYMAIARHGYFGESAAFFPLWPLVIRLLGSGAVLAKIGACLFTFVFIILFGRLITLLNNSKDKQEIILIFLAFPASFLLVAPFSEPLFLTLAVFTFLLAEKKRFAYAALFAALASATRPVGVVLTLYLFLKITEGGMANLRRYWWVLLISPLGLVLYSLYLYLEFGNFTLFWSAQTAGWGRQFSLLSVQKLFLEPLEVGKQLLGPVKPVPINFLEAAVLPFSIFLAALSFRKLSRPLWVYSVLVILIPLSSGTYLAALREMLAAFPLFIPFGNFLVKRKTLLYFYLFLAVLFQSLLLIRFFNFEWVA